ncbi:MAG TPA: sigma-70 family RNA polymerase sigma factor [Bryobacteraceae bacterium]|nr:sigma-70 family RNA polymerase sigma factor [Bryobacteraceae bacterium]
MKLQPFDAEYVRRLTEGDPAVEAHFAAYFGNLMYLKLRMRVRSPELIEDIRQETLLRVLAILRHGGGVKQPERFGAFVNAVCDNVTREQRRSDHRYDHMDEEVQDRVDTSIDLDSRLVNDDLKRRVTMVLQGLSEKDRNILRALYLDELDKTEICLRYRVDPGYLRVLLYRAKAHFREAYVGLREPPLFSPPAG